MPGVIGSLGRRSERGGGRFPLFGTNPPGAGALGTVTQRLTRCHLRGLCPISRCKFRDKNLISNFVSGKGSAQKSFACATSHGP